MKMVYCILHAQTHCKTIKTLKGVKHALTEAVSHHLHSAEAKVRSQASTCQICGGQSNIVTRFYRNMSVSPVNIILTCMSVSPVNIILTFMSVSPVNIILTCMSVSPVNIIPPTLHTHSYIYHRHNGTCTADSIIK